MLTAFVLIQVGINLALLLGLARLLKEREATARQACQREERLEALAAEICAIGRDLARRESPALPTRPPVSEDTVTPPRIRETTRRGEEARVGEEQVATTDRFLGAAALLERGVPIETVAAETALLAGEVQVLRNLRRASGSAAGHGEGRQSRAAVKKSGGTRLRATQSGSQTKSAGLRAEA